MSHEENNEITSQETQTHTGTVKFYNETWGYGMIIPDDRSLTEFMEKKDIMAHATKLLQPIAQFDRVEFKVKEKDNKIRAFDIKKIANGVN